MARVIAAGHYDTRTIEAAGSTDTYGGPFDGHYFEPDDFETVNAGAVIEAVGSTDD